MSVETKRGERRGERIGGEERGVRYRRGEGRREEERRSEESERREEWSPRPPFDEDSK